MVVASTENLDLTGVHGHGSARGVDRRGLIMKHVPPQAARVTITSISSRIPLREHTGSSSETMGGAPLRQLPTNGARGQPGIDVRAAVAHKSTNFDERRSFGLGAPLRGRD